jgi:hypothetical protein
MLCQNCTAIGEQLSEIYAFEHDLRFCTNGYLHFYLYIDVSLGVSAAVIYLTLQSANYEVDKQ